MHRVVMRVGVVVRHLVRIGRLIALHELLGERAVIFRQPGRRLDGTVEHRRRGADGDGGVELAIADQRELAGQGA